MKKVTLLLLVFIVMSFISQAQIVDVNLISHLDQYTTKDYSDIWGYVDDNGIEYAIMGVEHGTTIVSLQDPQNPIEVAFITGPNSIWRDIKTHSHYAYIVTEGTSTGKGLQIVDLSQLPATATLVNTVSTYFERAHNIYIDNGYAYVIGTNFGGLHILDLSNPTNPVQTAYYSGSSYIHDIYVWNDTAVAAAADSYDLLDLTNKTAPFKISETGSATPNGIYAHSGWMTEDKRYFIACEEFDQRDIMVWDLQDRTSWELVVPMWQMTGTTPVHNLFIKGNFAYISYYKQGLVVLDITDPTNPIMAGWYDTYAPTTGTYNGAWGCYPYLPSGNILISDINSGLWVLDFLLDPTTPVELTSFTYSLNDYKINLEWITASEINNSGYDVQRSTDKINWQKIGFVPGKGTTTEKSSYSFTDFSPMAGKSYYRLAQIDFDGTINIEKEIEVDFLSLPKFELAQNYPNPFNPSTKISFTIPEQQNVTLKIFNSLGEEISTLISEVKPAGAYTVNFDASNLPSGLYIAQLQTGSSVQSIKMSLVK